MIFSLKQSSNVTIPKCNYKVIDHRRNFPAEFLVLPPLSKPKFNKFSIVSSAKPLNVSSIQSFGSFQRLPTKVSKVLKAYEADRSEGESVVEKVEAARRVKIGVYFATWWSLNVIFNIYNKKVLNAFPYPWLTSTLSLAAGSAIMLISWATKVAEAPTTDLDFWKSLFPVSNFWCFLGFMIWVLFNY